MHGELPKPELKAPPKHRLRSALVWLIVLAAVGGALWYVFVGMGSTPQRQFGRRSAGSATTAVPVLAAQAATADVPVTIGAVGTTQALNTVTWSPDGREIAYAAPAGSVPALFRAPVVGGAPVRIPTPGGATSPAWSVARNVIAYLRGKPGQSSVALVTPAGEEVKAEALVAPRFSQGTLAWSADGRFLAGTIDPGTFGASGVWALDLDTPRAGQLTELPHGQRLRGVTWLPNGKGLIIGVLERTSDIVLFDQGS